MATDTGTPSASWLIGLFVIGAAAGATIFYFASPKCPKEPVTELKFVGLYDSEQISQMLEPSGAAGIRFYLANGDAGATAAAGPVQDDGQHIADDSGELRFRMFKSISGSATEMTMLNEDEAERQVKGSGTAAKPAWCIEATAAVLRTMLAVEDCNAIALMERNTTDGTWTFDLLPVKLSDGTATPMGDVTHMAVGAPCPRFCGRDAAFYLNMRE